MYFCDKNIGLNSQSMDWFQWDNGIWRVSNDRKKPFNKNKAHISQSSFPNWVKSKEKSTFSANPWCTEYQIYRIKIFPLKGWYFKHWRSGKLIEKKRWNASQNATVTVFALNGLWPKGIPTPYGRLETKAKASRQNERTKIIIIIPALSGCLSWWNLGWRGGGMSGTAVL